MHGKELKKQKTKQKKNFSIMMITKFTQVL